MYVNIIIIYLETFDALVGGGGGGGCYLRTQ